MRKNVNVFNINYIFLWLTFQGKLISFTLQSLLESDLWVWHTSTKPTWSFTVGCRGTSHFTGGYNFAVRAIGFLEACDICLTLLWQTSRPTSLKRDNGAFMGGEISKNRFFKRRLILSYFQGCLKKTICSAWNMPWNFYIGDLSKGYWYLKNLVKGKHDIRLLLRDGTGQKSPNSWSLGVGGKFCAKCVWRLLFVLTYFPNKWRLVLRPSFHSQTHWWKFPPLWS